MYLKKIVKAIVKRTFFYSVLYKYIARRNEKKLIFQELNLNRNDFFLISDSCQAVGILSGWSHYMTLVNFALKHNLIPIIDFTKKYMPVFMDKDYNGKDNYWDFYFTQPQAKYTVDNIPQKANVVYVDYNQLMKKYGCTFSRYSLYKNSNNDYISQMNKKDTALVRKFYKKCHLSDSIIGLGDSFIVDNKIADKKVLGVSFRRGFERFHKLNSPITPEGTHPIKSTLEKLLIDVEHVMQEFGFECFFLTTDDRESLDKMKEKFENKCLHTNRRLQHMFENNEVLLRNTDEETIEAIFSEFEGVKDPVKTRNIEYLTDVYILSKCNSLLARGGSADVFAYIINDDKYEHIYE